MAYVLISCVTDEFKEYRIALDLPLHFKSSLAQHFGQHDLKNRLQQPRPCLYVQLVATIHHDGGKLFRIPSWLRGFVASCESIICLDHTGYSARLYPV